MWCKKQHEHMDKWSRSEVWYRAITTLGKNLIFSAGKRYSPDSHCSSFLWLFFKPRNGNSTMTEKHKCSWKCLYVLFICTVVSSFHIIHYVSVLKSLLNSVGLCAQRLSWQHRKDIRMQCFQKIISNKEKLLTQLIIKARFRPLRNIKHVSCHGIGPVILSSSNGL